MGIKMKNEKNNLSYEELLEQKAEKDVNKVLELCQIPKNSFYTSKEVCSILRISERTFRRKVNRYEENEYCNSFDPSALDSITLKRNRRVSHFELISYFARNKTYNRKYGDSNFKQLTLF